MSKTNYVSDYKNQNELRLSFNNSTQKIFGINFENWYQKGFWNESYICHSFVSSGQIISNVSISKMQLLINGKVIKAIQVGTVFTHPEFRMNGLSKKLMNIVKEIYEKDYEIFYLFPNESVMKFYPKFGYSLTYDLLYSFKVNELKRANVNGCRKINIDDKNDLNKLQEIISSRLPRSNRFDCINSSSIFMWYCFNVFTDMVYILEPENFLVIFEEKENFIHLYDIVVNRPVNLHDIINRIKTGSNKEIIFYFTPSFKDLDEKEFSVSKNEDVFIMPFGSLPERSFAHPIMAHT